MVAPAIVATIGVRERTRRYPEGARGMAEAYGFASRPVYHIGGSSGPMTRVEW